MIGASSSAALAPGFRFHPTDEELVGYYLQRKICGRPLRVDAIAEVDLYKCEPWDLPGRSRIQSRDLEWYFFSALDRKYSNRSRTNRATGHGFWKMTGKDRPVRHRARVVGMKKTLVFHAGRAPHGSRTNWVMHEYRLEDEELAHSGVLQDAYVVCRIFQKSGSGPQNGAQYGALFVEEEWEEEADGLVVVRDGSDHVREQEHFQFTDILQNQELGNQHEDAPTIVEAPDGQDGGDHTDDPTMLLEMLADPTSIESMVDCVNEPKLQINPTHVNGLGEQGSMENCGHSSCHNNGYVELNDILNASNVGCHCTFEDSTGDLLGTFCEQNTVEGVENSSLQGMTNTETFSDPENHYSNHPELLHLSPVLDHFYLQFSDPGQRAEDYTMFYDACSNDLPITPDDCVLPNELLHSPTADPSGFKFDDLMGFSDTTDYLYDDTTDFSEKVECINSPILGPSNFAEEVNHVYNATTNNGGASSSDVPVAKNQFENFTAAPDVQKNEGRGKTITELLVTMLGSISAPPAFAVEFSEGPGKHLGQICATESTSSIHIMARMIHMRSLTVTGSSDNCSLQKIRNMGLFLPCNKADRVVGKPTGCGRKASVSMFFRNVLNLFLLSGFVLAVSYKVGMCICFRVNCKDIFLPASNFAVQKYYDAFAVTPLNDFGFRAWRLICVWMNFLKTQPHIHFPKESIKDGKKNKLRKSGRATNTVSIIYRRTKQGHVGPPESQQS